MIIKYVNERTSGAGDTYWAFNPPKYLREALDVRYKKFTDISDARQYSVRIDDAYIDFKRRNTRQHHIQDSTVNGVFSYYLGQDEYIDTAPNTKTSFRMLMRNVGESRLESSNVRFGDMLAKNVSNEHAIKLKNTIRENFSHHRAVHCMKVMRLIWNVGKRANRVSHNPFEKMRLKAPKARTVLWEDNQVDSFIQACDALLMPNLGLMAMMCYHLCQRPGDMRQVTFNNLHGQELRFPQEKTGTHIDVVLTQPILDRMAALEHVTGTIVRNDLTGNPHTRWSYYKQYRTVCRAAGLPDELRMSDLRRTGATEMAESGASADEIRAVTGHQSRDILNIYVRPTRGIAKNGMKKRFG
jgi:integrase|tara:strand:+ start:1244 stop:2308 length:1065 start_codon:yes stop_codon:yes gene_type:complete